MSKEFFDIVVIIPLEEEMREFLGVFRTHENKTTDSNITYGISGPNGVSILAIMQETMGHSAALKTATFALERYSCSLAISLGIAGGFSKDVSLGTVCYSGKIIDVYNNAKVTDGKSGGISFEPSPDFYQTAKQVSGPMGFVRVMPELQTSYEDWILQQAQLAEKILPGQVIGRDGEAEDFKLPTSICGPLACGHVTQSEDYNETLLSIDRSILGIDTESGALFDIAYRHNIDALTIRGISDYANRTKGKLESSTKDLVRKIAANNAASFLELQLSNPFFLNALFGKRPKEVLKVQAPPVINVDQTLPSAQTQQLALITEKLRELSHHYRMKPDGYLLPLPRVRERENGENKNAEARTMRIHDAIAEFDRVVVTVPPTYPDVSLPWIIAHDLIYSIENERQLLPVVLEGNRIKRATGELSKLTKIPLEKIHENGGQIVFIIDEVMFKSKKSTEFLASEIKKYSNSKFIILSHENPNLIEKEKFCSAISANRFVLGDIPFSEITTFVQKHYNMPTSEAEIIALRLRNLFRRFKLMAHPTYFAGIPEQMLASVLEANRRAELIQLAVDGFLSLVVASDKQKVRLSRTTRMMFLRAFARRYFLEHHTPKRGDVLTLIQTICAEYGYDVTPAEFLQSFCDAGIMIETNGVIEIILPFLRAYVLALDLIDKPDEAEIYFDPFSEEFDILTFELYAEMSNDVQYVTTLNNLIAKAIQSNGLKSSSHILLSNVLNPASIRKEAQVKSVQNRIGQLVSTIGNGVSEKDKKQKILDLSDRLQEMKDEAEEKIPKKKLRSKDSNIEKLNNDFRIWYIGVVLLGQGSERIPAKQKRELTTGIIELGSIILHNWTTVVSKIDFEKFKAALISDEMINDIFSEIEGPEDRAKLKMLISSLADIIELTTLSEPIKKVLSHMCENARHNVLLSTIEASESKDTIAELMRSSWLTDMSASKGSAPLKKVEKTLPEARFLRFAISTHYISRVYWSVADESAKMELLNSADRMLRRIGRVIPKGEIKRAITSESEDKNE